MLTATFYGEVPGDLGFDAAWLGRDMMLALMDSGCSGCGMGAT